MCTGRNVMVIFKPQIFVLVSDLGGYKGKTRLVSTGVEPVTFCLLVQMLYHWATGDSWEVRPLNQVHVGKNPTYCYDWNVLMRNDRNVMVNFKPRRILDKDVCFSRWLRWLQGKTPVVSTGVGPLTFCLLVQMLYHWATGDSWELRPLNQFHVTKILHTATTWMSKCAYALCDWNFKLG